jgi:hypothetical protein
MSFAKHGYREQASPIEMREEHRRSVLFIGVAKWQRMWLRGNAFED